jgi:membrane protein YdbS with pleckstrin-like domain
MANTTNNITKWSLTKGWGALIIVIVLLIFLLVLYFVGSFIYRFANNNLVYAIVIVFILLWAYGILKWKFASKKTDSSLKNERGTNFS